jgi:hypothetical protein
MTHDPEYAPTPTQLARFRDLVGSPVFADLERTRALTWLEQHATRQTIPEQLEWLAQRVREASR